MQIALTLNEETAAALSSLAANVSRTPEELAKLFVEDGIRAFLQEPSELISTLNGKEEP